MLFSLLFVSKTVDNMIVKVSLICQLMFYIDSMARFLINRKACTHFISSSALTQKNSSHMQQHYQQLRGNFAIVLQYLELNSQDYIFVQTAKVQSLPCLCFAWHTGSNNKTLVFFLNRERFLINLILYIYVCLHTCMYVICRGVGARRAFCSWSLRIVLLVILVFDNEWLIIQINEIFFYCVNVKNNLQN